MCNMIPNAFVIEISRDLQFEGMFKPHFLFNFRKKCARFVAKNRRSENYGIRLYNKDGQYNVSRDIYHFSGS